MAKFTGEIDIDEDGFGDARKPRKLARECRAYLTGSFVEYPDMFLIFAAHDGRVRVIAPIEALGDTFRLEFELLEEIRAWARLEGEDGKENRQALAEHLRSFADQVERW